MYERTSTSGINEKKICGSKTKKSKIKYTDVILTYEGNELSSATHIYGKIFAGKIFH